MCVWRNRKIGSLARSNWWKLSCIDRWWTERSRPNKISSSRFKICFQTQEVLRWWNTYLEIWSWTDRLSKIIPVITCRALDSCKNMESLIILLRVHILFILYYIICIIFIFIILFIIFIMFITLYLLYSIYFLFIVSYFIYFIYFIIFISSAVGKMRW